MLKRIERRFPSLSRAEQRVAGWVLAHPRRAADATLAEVAAACGASEPTVIRFCRRIGLDGFRDFTLRLTEALSLPASYVHRDVGPDDTIPDAVSKVVDASIRALVETRAVLPSMPLDRAASRIQKARQLVFLGLGASGHVATDAAHKFFRLGIPCSAMSDGPSMLQLAAIVEPADVLLFISAKGGWTDTIDAARIARERGATVIALTEPASELAASSAIVLGIEALEDTGIYTPMSSRLTQLAVLDALHVALALSLGHRASENLRAGKEALARRRAAGADRR